MAQSDLILYDGVCGLCNRLCRFVLRYDRHARFLFAPLQSEPAIEILRRHGLRVDALDTMVVVGHDSGGAEVVLTRSGAALYVLRHLGGFWRLPALARHLPAALLDRAYDLVARRRYRIFGKFDTCPVPPLGVRERFLSTQVSSSSVSPPSGSEAQRSGPGAP